MGKQKMRVSTIIAAAGAISGGATLVRSTGSDLTDKQEAYLKFCQDRAGVVFKAECLDAQQKFINKPVNKDSDPVFCNVYDQGCDFVSCLKDEKSKATAQTWFNSLFDYCQLEVL